MARIGDDESRLWTPAATERWFCPLRAVFEIAACLEAGLHWNYGGLGMKETWLLMSVPWGEHFTGETMQRIEIELEDDLTGGPADETVQFAFDGTTYELDLSAGHAADLRHRLAPFVERARRVRRRGGRVPVRTAASRERSREIRAWADQQGLDVAAHGRLPGDVIARYEKALEKKQAPTARGGRPAARKRGR